MISVCSIKDETKFTALLASRVPYHPALEYDDNNSERYVTIMKWFSVGNAIPVFEKISRTHNGILYSVESNVFIDFNFECYKTVNIMSVFAAANVSTNNSELLESMEKVDPSFSSLILESDFDAEFMAEARRLGFVGPKFDLDERFLASE